MNSPRSDKSDHSGNLGPPTLALAWVLATISTLVVALRFYVRIGMLRKFNIDDCIIVVTLLCVIGLAIFLTVAVSWGFGKHAEALASDPLALMYSLKWIYLCEFFAIMTPVFGRISYAFLLSSIIPPSKSRRVFLWVLVGIHFVTDVVVLSVTFSQCRPFEGYWNKAIEPDCWPPTIQTYGGYLQGSVGTVVDFVQAIFPCSLFWNLNMHWKQKVFLSSIMGLGIFAMIASIIKTIEIKNIGDHDLTYSLARLAMCAIFETNLVLLSASIPTVVPVFKPSGISGTNRDRRADNLNTFLSWKRAQAKMSGANHGSFEPLGEPTLADGVDGNEGQKVLQAEAYALRDMHRDDARDDRVGIRKDIRVSISFDQGSPSTAQTPQRASRHVWRT
ncbi:hypothetical protein F4811DRAFT_518812 [Daldinia bambusicola]|nr:hypothetical protein F4811DRAFT_518812 [Daldinia bambusicola]